MNGSWDEYGLFSESINDYEDRVGTVRSREGFNEVHRDRVPGSFRNRELFQQAIRLVSLGFGSHTSSTRLAIFLDKFMESRPSVFLSDEFNCLILARMTSKYVIMFVA